MHAHEDNKKATIKVIRRFSDPLDYDEAEEALEEAAVCLDFVMSLQGKAWLKQNRSLLEFIQEECELDLWSISCRYDHLDPPSLRDEYDLPPPTI